jgi:K+-transporting ATPase A subunit
MAKMVAQHTSSQMAMCLLFAFIEGLMIGSGDPDYSGRKVL